MAMFCCQCGMPLGAVTEYHPFAACQMYLYGREPSRVRANLAAVEAHGAAAERAACAELVRAARCVCGQFGESWAEGAGEWDYSESRNEDGSDRYVDGERVWPRLVRHHTWCPQALAAAIEARGEEKD